MENNARRLFLELEESIEIPFSTDFFEGTVRKSYQLPAYLGIMTIRLPRWFK
jgi:hypothetical protein